MHPHSLISAFVICVLENIKSRLATSKTPIFYLVSIAEQAGLNLTLSETPEDRFFLVTAHTVWMEVNEAEHLAG